MEQLFKDIYTTIKNYELLKIKYQKLEKANEELRNENNILKKQLNEKQENHDEIRIKTLQMQNAQLLELVAGTISLSDLYQEYQPATQTQSKQLINCDTFEQQFQQKPKNHMDSMKTSTLSTENPSNTMRMSTHQSISPPTDTIVAGLTIVGSQINQIPQSQNNQTQSFNNNLTSQPVAEKLQNNNQIDTGSQFAIFQSPQGKNFNNQSQLPAMQLLNNEREGNQTAFTFSGQVNEHQNDQQFNQNQQPQTFFTSENTIFKSKVQLQSQAQQNNFVNNQTQTQQKQNTFEVQNIQSANKNSQQELQTKKNVTFWANQQLQSNKEAESTQQETEHETYEAYEEQSINEHSQSNYQNDEQQFVYEEGEEPYEEYYQEDNNYANEELNYDNNYINIQDEQAISISSDSEY